MLDLLKKCGISDSNFGSCVGGSDWSKTKDAGINTSINPSNENEIASVFEANKSDYEKIVKQAQSAFNKWRLVPAPVRGNLVREMGNALRDKKDALGELVSLEWEKLRKKVSAKFKK